MDRFVHKKETKKNSPVLALLDMQTGLVRDFVPKSSTHDTQKLYEQSSEEENKKRKKTAITQASDKRRKEHEEQQKNLKAQQSNGSKFNTDGTLAKVERPWKRYTKLPQGCNNTPECKNTAHAHEKDRTLIGQLDHNAAAMSAAHKTTSPLLSLKPSAKAAAAEEEGEGEEGEGVSVAHPEPVLPAHDHHPFMCITTPVLPLNKQCTEIVTQEAELEAQEKISVPELRGAAHDLFHTLLRVMREDLNAYHACMAQCSHIKNHYEKNKHKVNDHASPARVLREMAEVKEKRLQQAENDRVEITGVIRESLEQKVRQVVERCVASSLLRPSAQEILPRELHAYYKEFAVERSEVALLDKIVALLKREECHE